MADADNTRWTRTESAVWQTLCAGRPADLTALPSDESRTISSEFLRRIVLRDRFRGAAPGRGVEIHGAILSGPLRLSETVIPMRLALIDVVFSGHVDLRGARVARSMAFDGSRFCSGADLHGLDVSGELSFRFTRFPPASLPSQPPCPDGVSVLNDSNSDLTLTEARTTRTLDLTGLRAARGVDLGDARVSGNLRAERLCTPRIDVSHARIDGDLLLGRLCAGTIGQAPVDVNAVGTVVKGFMDLGIEIDDHGLGAKLGHAQLNSISVAGSLRLNNLASDMPLTMKGAHIGNNVFLKEGDLHSISLRGSRIGGELNLARTHLKTTLDAQLVVVNGSVVGPGLTAGSDPTPESREDVPPVDFSGAKVSGAVNFAEANILGDIRMDSIDISRSTTFSSATFRLLDMRNARLGGQLELDQLLTRPDLDLSGIVAQRDLFIDRSRIGTLSLQSARIAGDVVLKSTTFGAPVHESPASGRCGLPHSANPSVSLRSIQIGGSLDLTGGVFRAFDLHGARIGSALKLATRRPNAEDWVTATWLCDGFVDLSGANVQKLQHVVASDVDAWPARITLEGLTYQEVEIASEAADVERRVAHLSGWLGRSERFARQPYQQLASVLTNAGDQPSASEVLFAGRNRERLESRGLRRLGLDFLYVTIGFGYGHRYFLSLLWVMAFTTIGAAVLRASGEAARHQLGRGYVFSFDMLVPLVTLDSEHDKVVLKSSVRHYFFVHKVVGVLLGSFLVAGLGGLTQ